MGGIVHSDPKKRIAGAEMLKSLIPALTIALLGNSVVTAQYFGAENPASSGYSQSARPVRIARAKAPDPQASPIDDLDELDALDSPSSGDVPQSVLAPLVAPPKSLDESEALEPPDSLDIPERLELPTPAEVDKAVSPSDSRIVQPEISERDLQALQPSPVPQSILELSPAPATPLPGPVDFNEAILQQQRDLAYSQVHSSSSQYYGAANYAGLGNASHMQSDCGCNQQSENGCGSCQSPLPYRAPLLPPSNSFHGHFRSNPCYYDLWANYPNQSAAACAHSRAMLAPPRKTGCRTCELVDPCPCR